MVTDRRVQTALWRIALAMLVASAVALAAGTPAGSPPADAQANRPNVLFLIADDLNVDVGAYGAPVSTPHIWPLPNSGPSTTITTTRGAPPASR